MRVSVIVPTYNERDNLQALFERISRAMKGFDYEIIVVDDNSPDGTGELAESLSRVYPVRVVKRPGKLGLASAVVDGLKHATGDVVVVMDADLQHPPEVIPIMLGRMNSCDIVVASRYARGGGVFGFPWYRRLMSRAAALIAWVLLPASRKTSDPMSGFFAFRRRLAEELKIAEPRGYKILLDLLARYRSARVCDQPYFFMARASGKSKMGLRVVYTYLRHVVKLAFSSL
uniref:Polyprenol monophosphomannose synthase n=1 Tax=Thermogladius calderae TaxID=1200300 RepID=A0A7J3XXF2_9CREN